MPIIAVLVLALWQLGLVGYTYMSAGNAAREGARELAVGDPAVPAIRDGVPGSWRDGLRCRVGVTRVRVSLAVPAVLPGLDTPLRLASSAGISAEDAPVGPIERSLDEPSKPEENACRKDDRAAAR
jgi:pilus assembly protein CpaE